jgi:Bromodomain
LETDSALTFLSHLGVSQYEVHKRVADTLLKHLDIEIRKTNSQEALLKLLDSCWKYSTTMIELRPVLWAVLKQLGKDTPTEILLKLGEQKNGEMVYADIFRPLPPLLKRLVWETDWDARVPAKVAEESDPQTFLECVQSTLLSAAILPHLKSYCNNEYLVTNANRPFVATVRERKIVTTQRRALTQLAVATTTNNAAPAAAGSTSPKAATLSTLTKSAAKDGPSVGSTAKGTTAPIASTDFTSGKSISAVRQLLSDPSGGTASYRPKLLYAVLSILIAEHGSLEDNLMGCAEHLHCTLVADLLLSTTTGLPKAYQNVLRLATVLDDAVKQGILMDPAIVKIQACLKEIFPPDKENPEDNKDGEKGKDNDKSKEKKNEQATKKGTPGKTAYDPIHEPTTAFKRQLSRIVNASLTAMKDADPQSLFLNPVTDAIAPGYSKVISKPMCIMTMEEKIDSHEYTTLQEWEADVKLMFQNCITYNRGAAGQWFRGEAQRQKKVFKDEILPQARRLYEKEVALRTKKEDVIASNKRKAPGADPLSKVSTDVPAASQVLPLQAVYKSASVQPEKDPKDSTPAQHPSMPALASMLLADPFVVRLILDRILRSLRLDVMRGKSLPTGHNILPSLLQLLHMAQWSNRVCAIRGKQYIVPDAGTIPPPAESEASAEEFLMKAIPHESLRRFLPMLSQLLLENELDQRVVVGGDLHEASTSDDVLAKPPVPTPDQWKTSSNIQAIIGLLEGALVYICRPGNAHESSLAVTYPKFAGALQEASVTICDERAFFVCLIEALLRHKVKLKHEARDVVVEHWLGYLRKVTKRRKRKKGPKKQKKWGNMTSAAHECLILLLNEWAALGNLVLPRDQLLKYACDAVEAAEESETLPERKFVAVWQESKGETDTEDNAFGNFTPIRKQYERMMESLPDDNYRSQWKDKVGLAALMKEEEEAEAKDVKMEDAGSTDVKMEDADDSEKKEPEDAKVDVKDDATD